MLVHYSKSAHAIGQNRSRVFWLPGKNESYFSALLTITNANCELLKMAAGSSFAEVDQEEIKGQKKILC